MTSERWSVMLRGLGARPDNSTYARLSAAYAERHRAYHTARHIDECLALFAQILMSFRDRPRIYHFEPLADRFEARARRNIAEAVRGLTGNSPADRSD